jgi:ribonucleoside-diphosphate reductase alpha chain
MNGPQTRLSQEVHATKYRSEGESFKEAQNRFASTLADNEEHFYSLRSILLEQRFMGGGRTQLAIGSPNQTTAFNCFVSSPIQDSFDSIMDIAKEAGRTMRKGGGIGYDFSRLRPKGTLIASLGSQASGPISFMRIYDSLCKTVSSAGHRRGAQMGVLRVDHPDIEEFIHAKQNSTELTAFNISVGVTNKFMECVRDKQMFDLTFEGTVHKQVFAPALWEMIMRSTWDWAEPGILFIDRINDSNNLHYCETIEATNPCGEQPLPSNGACLLGSYNLVKYVDFDDEGTRSFNFAQLMQDIPIVTRAMDNIHDNTVFPLEEQAAESKAKRRMGLGVTGLANAIEALGFPYGSEKFVAVAEDIFKILRDETYRASVALAKEKGAFPAYAPEYLKGEFIKTLPKTIRAGIRKYGIRNSHLLSFAPTGTISLTADNVSGGIEPVFSHSYDRTIQTEDGPIIEEVMDYGYRTWGVKGRTANECTADEHLAVLALSTKYVDSAVSKTINCSPNMAWEDFKAIYMNAWEMGCKGCTTFNSGGKRYGILNVKEEPKEKEAEACYINFETGQKECS